ncbi:hypothetical protein M5K25_027902 [Dendrobium thyrsiflorum]|uniref:Uncharacterized protein n=1 Tax=Dendrobium thyrsiflorum TaxID=117978 RepID=A0ABD0TV18_DENTH
MSILVIDTIGKSWITRGNFGEEILSEFTMVKSKELSVVAMPTQESRHPSGKKISDFTNMYTDSQDQLQNTNGRSIPLSQFSQARHSTDLQTPFFKRLTKSLKCPIFFTVINFFEQI